MKSNSFVCVLHRPIKRVNWKCFHFKQNTNLELKCTNWPKWSFIYCLLVYKDKMNLTFTKMVAKCFKIAFNVK